MKTTDLRIGNNVIDKDGDVNKVIGIVNNALFLENKYNMVGCPISWCKPIPIKEERLLLFGFKDISSSIEKIFEKDNFKWHSSTNEVVIELDNGINGYDLFTNCTLEHQLQNLFFTITSSELGFENEL